MKLNKACDESWKVWMWRLLFGPAMIIDGVVHTLSFSFVTTKLSLGCAKRMAKARLEAAQKKCVDGYDDYWA
jgi:hypothetical protein